MKVATTKAVLLSLAGILVGSWNPTIVRADSYSGIGVTIQQTNDKKHTQIVDIRADGPAAKAGILVGELIRAVDTQNVDGKSLDDVASLVRGTPGTTVTLSLTDEQGEHAHDVAVQREVLTIQCLLQGAVNLTLSGDPTSGSVSGFVGNTSIYWMVSNGSIYSTLGGKRVSLQVQPLGTNYTLSGWINTTSINWYSVNNSWITSTPCIPN